MQDDLPQRTAAHVKNDEAWRKFPELFKDPLFIVREETVNDYGVDIGVEALVNEGRSPSNIRSQVQLKSSSKACNKDGTYSYTVARSNLNYLHNSHGSIYVLYALREGQFYYRTADDVYREYNNSGKDWEQQKSITIKFYDVLDQKAVKAIHQNLIDTAQMFKALRVQLWEDGILPGARFVYGELHFDASSKEYLEANDVGYAYRADDSGNVVFMHNEVWQREHGTIPRGYQVYHINGDTLDNRRANLDIIKIPPTTLSLGEYETEIEAAQAYNIGALIIDGPSTELNDVPPPSKNTLDNVMYMLENQGWTANNKEEMELKTLLEKKLGMKF